MLRGCFSRAQARFAGFHLSIKVEFIMPKVNDLFLDTGDDFPSMYVSKVGGGKITLPDDLRGAWGVVLFYRSHW